MIRKNKNNDFENSDFFSKLNDRDKLYFIEKILKQNLNNKWALNQLGIIDSKYNKQKEIDKQQVSLNDDRGKRGNGWRRFIKWIIVFFVVFFVYLSFFPENETFPESSGAKKVSYKWNYRDQNYNLNLTLYKSSYDYYVAENCDSVGYDCFLEFNSKDNSIDQLVSDLYKVGRKADLSNDKLAELAISFVQNIPYDKKKGQAAVNGTLKDSNRHPYEVLYDKKGKCDEKSFLIDAILAKMGYGTTLFLHKQDKHMTAGVKCPVQYSTYGSGYCIIESTQVSRIGVAPLSVNSLGLASVGNSLFSYSSDSINLGSVIQGESVAGEDGNSYQSINEIVKIKNDIEAVGRALAETKNRVDSNQNTLSMYSRQMDIYKLQGNYWSYNNLVPVYNNLLNETNNRINLYNQYVEQYNNLLKQYYW